MFWRGRHEVHDDDLSAYVDDELGAADRRRVEAHLESCGACSATLDELRTLRQSLSEMPHPRAPRSFVLREADTQGRPASPASLLTSATPLLSGVAAVALVAFVVLASVDVASNGGDDAEIQTNALTGEYSTLDDAGAEAEEAPIANGSLPQPGTAPEDAGDAEPDREIDGGFDGAQPPADRDESGEDGEARTLAGAKPEAEQLSGGDDDNTLRIAELAAISVAAIAGATALLLWWRRRSTQA